MTAASVSTRGAKRILTALHVSCLGAVGRVGRMADVERAADRRLSRFPSARGEPSTRGERATRDFRETLPDNLRKPAGFEVERGGTEGAMAAAMADDYSGPPREKTFLIDEAAQLLGVSRRTVYYRIGEGRLQTIRTRCGSQRVLSSSIEALLGRTTGTPGTAVPEPADPAATDPDAAV
jgi:excisionase family DNA binding protein